MWIAKLVTPFLLVSYILALSEVTIPEGVSVVATRHVDLTTQIVKVKVEYEIKNQGKADINHFVHTISEDEDSHLAWISAYEKGKKEGARFRVAPVSVKGAPKGLVFYKVELLNLVGAGASATIVVDYSMTLSLTPYPAEITQAENQFVKYNGFGNVLSAYIMDKETTNFKVGNTKPISFTELNPSKYATDKVTYGPYEKQKPFVQKPITIHYENNSPFLVATSVERVIEVSHWGNIAVEELIEVVHKGAKLKGSFSRLDFQMDRRGNKQPVVKNFKTVLPSTSTDVYYRDQIGNISTSAVYPRTDRLEVELRPRFPLFGGWRTNYVLGYNVPTSSFLSSSGSDFALKIKLLDHLFDNAVVEKLRVKIILPEKSKNIKLVTPYSVKRLPDEIHKTYLDIEGRPVIVLEKTNLVDNHIQPFTLYYEWERSYIAYEPFIAIVAFFVLFLAFIIFFRLDFSISNKDGKEITHMKKD
ncbi:ribophorin I domain-containing protein [Ditylenchus destructor]|uniref:Dolichyl-diphosphooligosaccharide--protein glycosyltransferase subunit 1 n=1 Tax=Ditylenchus destructor TaxID=166010 RepID=A0AAD4NIT1_9BILA|nr:ribophorin I domain-containing protein [Ditylenchus destructor]